VSVLEIVRWCFAGFLGLLSIYIIGLNFSCVYLWLVRKEHHSLVPLIGGVTGVLALLICTIAPVHAWAWLPLVDLLHKSLFDEPRASASGPRSITL
jgi:hypothetical protein